MIHAPFTRDTDRAAPASDKGCSGMDLLDLLFDQTDGILRHEELGRHGNQSWPITERGDPSPVCGGEDFLDTLLSGCDSECGSPVWSPSDSGISEDPIDSPPHSPPFPPQCSHLPPHPTMSPHPTNQSLESTKPEPDISIDLGGWESGYCASSFSLTVKDLLLSGNTDTAQQASPPSFQELILNDDEKKLLAKEGVSLPNQLPLTKYEERILKKIRRKIRNKQSAQESRKKKKEYIDGLEGRMAACSAQNQELQRKVIQLEKNSMSLLEQLRRLQSLVMNGSNKTAQTGTCILVLLLSFSLVVFPSLQPFSRSEARSSEETDFIAVRVQSRSLRSVVEGQRGALSLDGGPEAIASLLAKLQLADELPISHNHSMEERGSHRGDPITGRIATVTWTANKESHLRPHADDM